MTVTYQCCNVTCDRHYDLSVCSDHGPAPLCQLCKYPMQVVLDGPHEYEIRSRKGLEGVFLDARAARGYAAEIRSIGAVAWMVPIPLSGERCPGVLRNGPGKAFTRCATCGAIDWEANEGDTCRKRRQV
jgi:hypothetical protein